MKKLMLICCMLFASSNYGQTLITGHYQPGFAGGLKSGIIPQGNVTLFQNGWLFYFANQFVDNSPATSPSLNGELNITATRLALVHMTGSKFLGANYGFNIAVPISNLAPNPVVVEGVTVVKGVGIGDIAISPIILAWQKANGIHLMSTYTAFLPTGRFNNGASNNIGKGFWTHMVSGGITKMQQAERPWHATTIGRLELHSSQKGTDITPGSTLTLEGGIGKSITPKVDIGAIGFLWKQLNRASGGSAIGSLKYGNAGLGAEVQFRPSIFVLKAKVIYDVWAENSTKGIAAVFEGSLPL